GKIFGISFWSIDAKVLLKQYIEEYGINAKLGKSPVLQEKHKSSLRRAMIYLVVVTIVLVVYVNFFQTTQF
ncbi:hypothetical protein N9D31_03540, partial [Oligoflexaceae bacterium]|nr:hypothetical protein [Oligoflexaceae bacterium]